MFAESALHIAMHQMELSTARLVLRPFQLNDFESLLPILSDPEVIHFIGKGPLTPPEIMQQLEQWISDFEKEGFGFMAFMDRNTGRLIGYGGFLHQVIEGEAKIELGYVLAKSHWRQGFAFEAAAALRDFGFASLQLNELISIIHEANIPSQKVASKLGMNIAKRIEIDGEPCLIYSCLRK